MLNLTVAMLKTILIFALLFQDSMVSISSPQAGDTLRGRVELTGGMDVPGFESAELAFAYASPSGGASDSADNWFVIQTFSQPTESPAIAAWDTTSISDGDYSLRLRVFLQDGSFQDALVTDLKVRNDEPLPTPQPTQTFADFDFQPLNEPSGGESSFSDPTPIAALPASTPLPPNPASLTTTSILSIFGKSALAILGAFVFISLFLRLRRSA